MTEFVDELQGRGRYTFTSIEAMAGGLRSGIALGAALRRLKRKGRIAALRRGFYVIVPLEYRMAGCPPATWFIDDLMKFLGQPYYVGILSAAAIHGAGHQQPMAFQVMTDRATRPVAAGRVRVVFHKGRHVATAPVVDVQTETGSMRVSSPETTAFDLVRFLSVSGGIGNVLTVLQELSEHVNADVLTSSAGLYAVPDVQRLGFLLEHIGEGQCADALYCWLQGRRFRPVLLVAGQERGFLAPHPRWRVVPNEMLEADL